MITKSTGFFSDIIHYLSTGNICSAFARGIIPLITLFSLCQYNLKFRYIIFQNRNNRNNLIVKVNDLYDMQLNLHDRGICQELSIYHKREFFTTDYFKEICKENTVFVDIGGNIGYYAILESTLSPEGKVFAIEPVPQNYSLLKKNIELNNCHNVQIFNYSIGDMKGNSEMYIYDKCNWCSFVKDPNATVVSTINVPMVTLDDFIKSYVDVSPNFIPNFIRMDVEGYEYNILKGASNTLNSISPMIICIEFHPHLMSEENTMECIEILKRSGFKIKSIIREANTYQNKYIDILNKIRHILNWPLYGHYGNSYESLIELLSNKYPAMAFFEKN